MPTSPPASLAAQARECEPLARARALAAWTGAARPVTSSGVLTVSGAAEAILALRLTPPGDEPELDLRQQTLFSADGDETRDLARCSPELMWLWELAVAVGFLRVEGFLALPGAAMDDWPSGPPRRVLAVWRAAFDALPSGGLADVLEPLYGARWLSLAELHDAVDDEVLGPCVAALCELGAAAVHRDLLRLTPLGRWAWRQGHADLRLVGGAEEC